MPESIQRSSPRPAVDRQLQGALDAIRSYVPGGMPSISAANLAVVREGFPGIPTDPETHFGRNGRFVVTSTYAPGVDEQAIALLVCRPADVDPVASIYYVHGGGMVLGSNVNGVDEMLDYADRLQLALVSVEYRLAPEHPYPAPVDDCFRGLACLLDDPGRLGLPERPIVVAGESAGGGLAAATVLRARDAGYDVTGQMLLAPMLDHRNDTESMRLLRDAGMWDRASNAFGWASLLAGLEAGAVVPPDASPALATDLMNLPASYLDVGGADGFRDEVMDYAARLSAAGNLVDLHLWAGAYHGFDGMSPTARVSRSARATRVAWLERLLLPTSVEHMR